MCAFPQGCLLPVRLLSLFCAFPSRRRLQPLMQWEGDASVCQVTCAQGILAAKDAGEILWAWSRDPLDPRPQTPDLASRICSAAASPPFPGRGGGWICNFTAACACAGVASAAFLRIAGAGSACLRIQNASQPEDESNLGRWAFSRKVACWCFEARTLHNDRQDDGENGGQNADRRRHPGKRKPWRISTAQDPCVTLHLRNFWILCSLTAASRRMAQGNRPHLCNPWTDTTYRGARAQEFGNKT